MIKYDRTKNSFRNTAFGLVLKIINLIGAFATRTMLIHILGVEYVGLDGLFSSILTMLNMAELGFSSAVVFKLYKPIADGETEKVCALINFYKKIYRVIGTAVLGMGLALLPILPKLVSNDVPDTVNLYSLYLIYLANTVLSYWLFAYKTALINAHQRSDLASKVNSLVYISKYVVQFLLLLTTKNYYCYAIVIPLSTVLTNIGSALIARKYYPQYVCKGQIAAEEKQEIKGKVSALIYNKIGVAIINGSDNLVISSFLGLTVLGIYDSYYYIFTMLYGFFDVFHNAITAGIGNSIVTESIQDNYKLYKHLNFINAWVVGWCSICMCCLYEPFIKLWIGEDKAFSPLFSLLMSVYFYFWMIRFVTLIFKNAQGLWREDRFRSIIEGVFNLTLNLISVKIIGIYGITASTIVAMLIVSLPWETGVLFKYYFKLSPDSYYKALGSRTVFCIIVGAVTYCLCAFIPGGPVLTLVMRACICVIVPNTLFWLMYHKSDDYEYAKELFTHLIAQITTSKKK